MKTEEFPLWPFRAVGARGDEDTDIPTLTPFIPEPGQATGAAVVVCPGGGYQKLAPHEGEGYALWLASHGITAFVLKYRLGKDGYRHPVMLWDAARAIRHVRVNAAKWKIATDRIGIMGSSAGGHLASTLLTHFDKGTPDSDDSVERVSSRPDLGILCYPVITMGEFRHQGSTDSLLGPSPTEEFLRAVSNELHVTADTPPCFLWHTAEDSAVNVENTLLFASALRSQSVPFDLHVYEKGRHGLGLGTGILDSSSHHPWSEALYTWLWSRKWIR